MPIPASGTPLADHLGWKPWFLDLVTAALGSIAANGLAACLLIAGAHGPKALKKRDAHIEAQTIQRSADAVDVTPKPKPTTATKALPKSVTVPAQDNHKHISQFAFASLDEQPGSKTTVSEIHNAYLAWCRSSKVEPLPAKDAAILLADLLNHIGVEVDVSGDEPAAVGVSIKPLLKRVA